MNTLQLIARTVGEKIALVYTRLKTHTAEKNIHRTSAEIRAEIVDADIPAGIARAEDMRQQLTGKVDKVPGKELMPSPGAQPRENHFLNERGEYVRIEPGSVILDIQMDADTSTFTVSREQLSEYVERAIVGGEPGLNVYFKHQNRPFSYACYKVTDIIFEYTTYWLTAYTNRQSEDDGEKDMVRHFTYSFIYDSTQPEPLLPNRGLVIDSPYYITTYIDRVLGGKADAGTVKTHLDNTAIHRTSAEIRAEIVDADIPSSIVRDAEADSKISVHNDAGNVHPGLRNSITNLENGTTAAGRSEYAQKLGGTNGSYTKTQLDTCLNGLIRNVTYDSATAKFTFWFLDGRTVEIDTPLENTVKDGRYDTDTASLVLVLVSGQEISIPVAGLNKIYTGKDTPTATTTVNAAGEISVALKQGTIDSVHLSSALQAAINSHLTLTGDTKDNITTFADQPSRVNLAAGDKHSLLFGKIKRWFSDLGALAFLNKVGKTDMDAALQGEINGKEPGFTKNTAFNKNFGTAVGTVCQGNDARLSNARTANGGNADTVGGKRITDFVQTNARNTINGSLTIKDSTYQPLLIFSHAQPNPASVFLGDRNDLVLRLHDNPEAKDTGTDIRINSDKFTWAGKQVATINQIPASLPAKGGTSEQTNAIIVHDTRASASTPSWLSRSVRFWFSCIGTPNTDWWSGLHINGWDSAYAAWELSGPSSTASPDSRALYFRSGVGGTFNAWQRVAFCGDLPTSLPASGGNADTVDGLHAAAIGTVEGGKLASYNNSGYFDATIFRDTFPTQDAETVGLVCFKISQADGYHRFCSLARFKAVLGGLPASDVYAWAKAASKPAYTATEVGAATSGHNHAGVYQPAGSYAAASHTHTASQITEVANKRFMTDAERTKLSGLTPSIGITAWATVKRVGNSISVTGSGGVPLLIAGGTNGVYSINMSYSGFDFTKHAVIVTPHFADNVPPLSVHIDKNLDSLAVILYESAKQNVYWFVGIDIVVF